MRRFGALGDSAGYLYRVTLKAAEESIGDRLRSRSEVASRGTVQNVEESRVVRLTGDSDPCRTLSGRTRTLLWRDKKSRCGC